MPTRPPKHAKKPQEPLVQASPARSATKLAVDARGRFLWTHLVNPRLVGFGGVVAGLLVRGTTAAAHGLAFEFDAMGVVHQTVEDGVGVGGIFGKAGAHLVGIRFGVLMHRCDDLDR